MDGQADGRLNGQIELDELVIQSKMLILIHQFHISIKMAITSSQPIIRITKLM